MEYEKGKIYRLICNKTGLIYYGSTTKTLTARKRGHWGHYNSYLIGIGYYVSSFSIMENKDFDIELVEYYPCKNKQELCAREAFYIKNKERL